MCPPDIDQTKIRAVAAADLMAGYGGRILAKFE